MKLLIGIPAYNEEQTLGSVIKSLPKKFPGIGKILILVVDDGSTDNTSKVAKSSGAWVAKHLINRGLGGAIKTIFEFARQNNFDYLITMDADGQHDSTDVRNILKIIIKKKSDVIIGSRWKKRNIAPVSRKIINKFANILTFFLMGISSSDSQSGLRAFNRKSIELIKLQTDGMEVSSEIYREIKLHKLTYREIPIKAIYSDYSKTKGQRIENAPFVFIQLLLRLLK